MWKIMRLKKKTKHKHMLDCTPKTQSSLEKKVNHPFKRVLQKYIL